MGKLLVTRCIIICLLLVSLLLSSCGGQAAIESADKQARKMMEWYNLHPAKGPEIMDTEKTKKLIYEERFFDLFNDASKQVGLDLNKGRGKKLVLLSYTLKERSQSYERTVTASFLCDSDGSMVGAFMSLAGYYPGIGALNERRDLYPDGLSRDKLSFKGLRKIELFGSFGENGWEASATLSKPEDMKRITSLLERSVGHKGTFEVATIGQEEYAIALHYKSGPIVLIRLAPRNPRDEMGIDNMFQRWHYYPPKELKAEIIRLLEATPNSTRK